MEIKFSIIKLIDKRQYSFLVNHYQAIKSLFDDNYHFLSSKKVKTKYGYNLIRFYQDAGDHQIELCDFHPRKYQSYFILHDMTKVPKFILSLSDIIKLSILELACKCFPKNRYELPLLKEALIHKVVLNQSRKDCFNPFQSPTDFSMHGTTSYIGNKGHIYKGSKGLKIYTKAEDQFVKVELNLNRDYLRTHSQPKDITDFITIRSDLNQKKLVKVLSRKYPLLRREKYPGLRYSIIENIVSNIADGSDDSLPVSQQMSNYKNCFQGESLISRINEFFPLTGESLLDGMISYP